MIPAVFVTMPALPVTANGKIDRQALPMRELERVRPERSFQSPSTETERRLADIWEQILDVSPIGATDNFFELGADSLDAMRLVTLIEVHFGVDMLASLLWEAPTLARMASVLENRSLFELCHGSDVVALQPSGSRIPLFCFPGADDYLGRFMQLALSLGGEQPFYLVRDPVQKSGPCVLAGHCYGGLVAFEVARWLAAQGERVSKVVMIEVPAPGYPKVFRNWRNYLGLTIAILRRERHVALLEARLHFGVIAKLARKRAASWIRRVFAIAPPIAVENPDGIAAHADQHPNAQAGRNYVPKRCDCDLVQIIAAGEHHSTAILDDPRLGWRDLTEGAFTVAETPGSAEEIFKQPYVRGLAAQIESLLDGINSGQNAVARF